MISNKDIAQKLLEYARKLRERHDNLYRVRAYGLAADAVMRLDKPVAELVKKSGRHSLEELPGIGRHIARSIEHFVETGEWESER